MKKFTLPLICIQLTLSGIAYADVCQDLDSLAHEAQSDFASMKGKSLGYGDWSCRSNYLDSTECIIEGFSVGDTLSLTWGFSSEENARNQYTQYAKRILGCESITSVGSDDEGDYATTDFEHTAISANFYLILDLTYEGDQFPAIALWIER